jgi:alpha-tubulin suppressor-like RCC1 family protein
MTDFIKEAETAGQHAFPDEKATLALIKGETPAPEGRRTKWGWSHMSGPVLAPLAGVAAVGLVFVSLYVAQSGHGKTGTATGPKVSATNGSVLPTRPATSGGSPQVGSSPTPTALAPGAPGQVPGGGAQASGNTVSSWGENGYGELGNGSYTSSNSPVTMNFPAGTKIKQIVSGNNDTVVLLADGTVWATGDGLQGEMGNGTDAATVNTPTKANINNVISIAAGQFTIYAVKSDGTLWSWGYNSYGQLGDGTTNQSLVPVQVSGLGNVVEVAAQRFGAAALRSDGTVWAWGDNPAGNLGNNTTCTPSSGCTGSTVPVQVHGANDSGFLTGVVAITCGRDNTLALKSDGTVWGWGFDGWGQLGDNSRVNKSVPVPMLNPAGNGTLTGVASVSGGGTFTLMLMSNGTVLAAGYDTYGDLGDNNPPSSKLLPVPVLGLSGVKAVSAGYDSALALKNDGTVWSWGRNEAGELGPGAPSGQSNVAAQVPGIGNVLAVSAGGSVSLALR